MTATSRDAPGTLEAQGRPPPTGSRQRRHRRPTGQAPPLPRHVAATGVGWLVAATALITLSLLVFTAGRYGHGISVTVVDHWLLERLTALRTPGLERVMLAVSALLGTIWTIKVLAWTSLVVLVVSKRFRHLVVGLVSVQVVAPGHHRAERGRGGAAMTASQQHCAWSVPAWRQDGGVPEASLVQKRPGTEPSA